MCQEWRNGRYGGVLVRCDCAAGRKPGQCKACAPEDYAKHARQSLARGHRKRPCDNPVCPESKRRKQETEEEAAQQAADREKEKKADLEKSLELQKKNKEQAADREKEKTADLEKFLELQQKKRAEEAVDRERKAAIN